MNFLGFGDSILGSGSNMSESGCLREAEYGLVGGYERHAFDAGGCNQDAVCGVFVHGLRQVDGLDRDLWRQRKERDAGLGESLVRPSIHPACQVKSAGVIEHGEFPDGDDGDEDKISLRGYVDRVRCGGPQKVRKGLIAKPDMGIEEEQSVTHPLRSTRRSASIRPQAGRRCRRVRVPYRPWNPEAEARLDEGTERLERLELLAAGS